MSDVEEDYGAAAAEVGSKRAAGRLSGAERGEAPAARGVKKARLAQFLADEAEQSDHGGDLHASGDEDDDDGSVNTYASDEGVTKRDELGEDESSADDDDSDDDSDLPVTSGRRRGRGALDLAEDQNLILENMGIRQAYDEPERVGRYSVCSTRYMQAWCVGRLHT